MRLLSHLHLLDRKILPDRPFISHFITYDPPELDHPGPPSGAFHLYKLALPSGLFFKTISNSLLILSILHPPPPSPSVSHYPSTTMLFQTTALVAILAAAQGVFGSACEEQRQRYNACREFNKDGSYHHLKWCLCERDEGLFHQAWQCAVEKAVTRAGGDANHQSVARESMYWKQYFIEFKFRYCQDPDNKFQGNYDKAWESHHWIWDNRMDLTKI
ncbi:hypothetical protein L249_8276 [Ophiocordyceps polyrhachis-furcata BCC 54312]|uniref:Uncharacterized protein n=1 Tax=Ophiocordyceps polyrhachis-furcata BCC 54312 TaxID=1330021 RepID=A0A367LIA2_9HYPO|nr:hypothetical protein L249_8276 [Ophiocordyceps polyrhachis-furcata BCC 54312]